MKLSACVIVKNEAKNIEKWIANLRQVVDELIIVDTGSEDNTIELIESAGITPYHYEWNRDFAAAKNYAIEQATGDWIVFLDADEYFTQESIEIFRELMQSYHLKKNVGGLLCRLTNIDVDNHNQFISAMLQVRIFRNISSIRYVGSIHEQLQNTGKNLDMVYCQALEILHTGYSSSIMVEKNRRNKDILLERYVKADAKEKRLIWPYLCDLYNCLGDGDNTLKYARRCIDENITIVGDEGKFYRMAVYGLIAMKRPRSEWLAICNEALVKLPYNVEFWLAKGIIQYRLQLYRDAWKSLENAFALKKKQEQNTAAGDQAANHYRRLLPRAYWAKGELYRLKGDRVKALKSYIDGLQDFAYIPELLQGLCRCLKGIAPVELIETINAYYNREADAEFIVAAITGIADAGVIAYYSKYLPREESSLAYMATGNYDAAAVELTRRIDTANRVILANARRGSLDIENGYARVLLGTEYMTDSTARKNSRVTAKQAALLRTIKSIRDESLPLVSIMIPTYNRSDLFEITLQSAMNQTYSNIEILVNDNSTDDRTALVMDKYLQDERIRYFRNTSAKCKADNFVPFEKYARGEYLQWCMDDDVLAPEKLSQMVQVLRDNPSVTLVSSLRGFIDVQGNAIDSGNNLLNIEGEYGFFSGKDAGKAMLSSLSNFIGEPSAVLFRREDLVHHYWRAESKGLYAISDVAMWLELFEKGDCIIFKKPLSYYRRHGQQEGQRPEVILLSRLEWVKLIEEYHRPGGFLTSDADYYQSLDRLYEEYQNSFSHNELLKKAENYSKYVEAMNCAGTALLGR